jgi:hypothetical protein
MDTWAKATPEHREALFNQTAVTKGISPEIIEKGVARRGIRLRDEFLCGPFSLHGNEPGFGFRLPQRKANYAPLRL